MTPLPSDPEPFLPASRERASNGAVSRWSPDGASRPAEAAGGQAPTLVEQLWRIARNRKWVILQALVLIPLAVAILTATQSKTYTATASLLFRANQDENLLSPGTTPPVTDPARDFATNEQLVNLPVVADRTAARLGPPWTGAAVRSSISVDATGESDVVGVTGRTPSPDDAARVANAYAQAYINYRRDADQAQLADAILRAQQSRDALPADQRGGAEYRRLTTRLNQLRLAQSLQTGNAEIAQRATPPASPSSPSLKRNLFFSLIIALVAGFGLAALLERLDRRLKSVEDIERAYNLPVISRVPRSSRLRRSQVFNQGSALLYSVEVEAFRTLRANLRYFNFGRNIHSVLVASAVQGEGKTTVSRYLAATMASMGDRVVLVEADLHKPGVELDARVPPSPGLSGVLVGEDVSDALRNLEVQSPAGEAPRRLSVLPAGQLPPNPSELLGTDRMIEVLAQLEEMFELVIIDTPPLSVVADALALVPQVSGVIVVAGLGQTTRDAALRMRKELAFAGGRPLGIVANRVALDRHEAYPYGAPERERRPARTAAGD